MNKILLFIGILIATPVHADTGAILKATPLGSNTYTYNLFDETWIYERNDFEVGLYYSNDILYIDTTVIFIPLQYNNVYDFSGAKVNVSIDIIPEKVQILYTGSYRWSRDSNTDINYLLNPGINHKLQAVLKVKIL